MPKIVLHEKHFAFLRILVNDFQEHAPPNRSQEVIDLTDEVLTLLGYAQHFKRFTIEIAEPAKDGET